MVVYCVNKHIEAIVQCNPRWKFLPLMQCKRCLDGFVVVRAAEIVQISKYLGQMMAVRTIVDYTFRMTLLIIQILVD